MWGGYDLTTGAANPGYYSVSFFDGGNAPNPVAKSACVNNVGGTFEADDTACTSNSVPMTWTSSDTIKAYLDIADVDASRVAPFLAKFADATPLTADDAWQNPGDEDLYFPALLN